MTNREPSRKIAVQSEDGVRWQRALSRILLAFIILHLCALLATRNAPPVVHTIQGLVFILGLVGLIGVAIVLCMKSTQHFRLVFTIHWTQPKEVTLALTRLWYKQIGMLAYLRSSALAVLVVSGPLALIWLLDWGTAQLDPSKHARSFPWALAVILLLGIGFAALPYLGSFLDALFSSKTIGFDKEWMGYLHGRPGKALWRYDRIASVRFEWLRVKEREFRLMIVSPREGREVTFGLPDEVDIRQIAGILADKGVEVAEPS